MALMNDTLKILPITKKVLILLYEAEAVTRLELYYLPSSFGGAG